jgi:Dolichyl-phosphate-mannose-protein mannosyltransferase
VAAHIQRLLCSVLFITVVAFGLRATFLVDQGHKVPAEALATIPFQNEVGSVAASLAQGQGFCCLFRQPSGPTAWLVPVYPLMLAGIFKIFGLFTVPSFYVAAFLNSIFSALACVPVFYVGRRIGGLTTAASAAWIWAFFPSGILMPFEWIWDSSLSALVAATLLWMTLYLAESSRFRDAIGYGLLWGFALLSNPALGAALPFFLLWLIFRRRESARGPDRAPDRPFRPASALLVVGAILVVCLPWTIRNAVQFHRLIPMRSNLPFELWMGNNELFDEHSRELNRISRFEEVHRYNEIGEMAFLDEKRDKAYTFIRQHPVLALRLAGERVLATWLGTSSPWRDFKRADSTLVQFLFFWNAVTLVGALAGIARLVARRNPFAIPLAIFPIAFPLVYYFTQTSLRLRHPCDPVLALLLAIAVTYGVTPPSTSTETA